MNTPIAACVRRTAAQSCLGAKGLWVSSVILVAVLASALATDAAWARGKGRSGGGARSAHSAGAHHHHGRSAVFVGAFGAAPLLPWWGYAPYAYATAPVHYVEQSDQLEGEWLYCGTTNAYFPNVAECPGGWQRIPAQPSLSQQP